MEARLRRSLFGYSRKSVRSIVDESEVAIANASNEAREGQLRVRKLTRELEQARIELDDLRARNRDLDNQLKEAAERFRVLEQSSSPSSSEGMTEVLHAAERALSRLTDAARAKAEQELGDTERVRSELLAEIDRLSAWRGRMAPLAESIPSSIDEVRRETAAMTGRLREAIAPAADAMETLSSRLSQLAGTPEAPIVHVGMQDQLISLEETSGDSAPQVPDAPPDVFSSTPSDRSTPPSERPEPPEVD